jgi:hypothetical protein
VALVALQLATSSSVGVEQIFSKGLLLSHIRNRLSPAVQSTRALICALEYGAYRDMSEIVTINKVTALEELVGSAPLNSCMLASPSSRRRSLKVSEFSVCLCDNHRLTLIPKMTGMPVGAHGHL